MTTIDSIKSRLIDRILVTENETFLEAIEKIFISTQKNDLISLSSEQIEMLLMSERDIKDGNLIADSDLDKLDAQWTY